MNCFGIKGFVVRGISGYIPVVRDMDISLTTGIYPDTVLPQITAGLV